jgi:lysophospholipase L1-like esterase
VSLRRLALPLLAALGTVLVSAVPAHAAGPSYVALGDSYSSGVGTRQYYADSGACQRSPYAYAVLDTARIGATLTFNACSGALIPDVKSKQLSSLNSATRYVSISVGGNDVGWAAVVEQCAKPWPFTCWGDIDNARSKIVTTLPGTLDALYSQIRSLAPNARVVVVGYPLLFNGEECNAITRISADEQAELNDAANMLGDTLQDMAASWGFGFADARGPFSGHAVCDDVEWVNGPSDPLTDSYHPNRNGHAGYADIVGPLLTSSAVAPAAATTAQDRARDLVLTPARQQARAQADAHARALAQAEAR